MTNQHQARVDATFAVWRAAVDAYDAALWAAYGKAAGAARNDARGRAGHLDTLYREREIARRNYLAACHDRGRSWLEVAGR